MRRDDRAGRTRTGKRGPDRCRQLDAMRSDCVCDGPAPRSKRVSLQSRVSANLATVTIVRLLSRDTATAGNSEAQAEHTHHSHIETPGTRHCTDPDTGQRIVRHIFDAIIITTGTRARLRDVRVVYTGTWTR